MGKTFNITDKKADVEIVETKPPKEEIVPQKDVKKEEVKNPVQEQENTEPVTENSGDENIKVKKVFNFKNLSSFQLLQYSA